MDSQPLKPTGTGEVPTTLPDATALAKVAETPASVSIQSNRSSVNSLKSRVKQVFSRRKLFSRTTAATGVLVVAAGGATALAASQMHLPARQALSTPQNNLSFTNPSTGLSGNNGSLREYWIQADAFNHNLVPTGLDAMSGMRYPANQSSYWAIGYRAYTPNWGAPLPGDGSIGANAGIPGPVIRAEVGDTIRVHFRNNDTHYQFCHSMHPHGVRYTPANDGAWTARNSNKPGTSLKVGESFTYEWTAVESSVGSWPYHDHAMPATIGGSSSTSNDSDMNPSNGIMELGAELGLFGMIVVTDATTPAVDREIILCFHDLYEADIPQLSQDFDCFNGYAFLGNTPTFEANVGERVRWRVMALGQDFHVFHLHGHRWMFNGRYDDALVLGPSTTLTFDYVEDNPGEWLYHCHVTEHMMGGMVGSYLVH